jgi:ribosomal protein S19
MVTTTLPIHNIQHTKQVTINYREMGSFLQNFSLAKVYYKENDTN